MTLEERIIRDLDRIHVPRDYTLSLRGYSKYHNGKYDPNTKTIIIYTLNSNGELFPYSRILKTAVHEATHHFQWWYTGYVRVKGVMHNEDFHSLHNTFLNRLDREVKRGAKLYRKSL